MDWTRGSGGRDGEWFALEAGWEGRGGVGDGREMGSLKDDAYVFFWPLWDYLHPLWLLNKGDAAVCICKMDARMSQVRLLPLPFEALQCQAEKPQQPRCVWISCLYVEKKYEGTVCTVHFCTTPYRTPFSKPEPFVPLTSHRRGCSMGDSG